VKSLIHRAPGVEAGPWVRRRRIRDWELGAETNHSRLTPVPNNREARDDRRDSKNFAAQQLRLRGEI